jgi:ribosomal protein S18 acetylase RimI-like enzyme
VSTFSCDSLRFEIAVDQERESVIEERLVAFNRANAALWEENHDDRFEAAPLHIYVRDKDSQLIAGLIGRTHALREWLEILVLWVDEPHRGAGVGRKLMARAEEEARNRGCVYARLASSNYQAPTFYEKLGYTLYGKLENCPPGDIGYYFWKRL